MNLHHLSPTTLGLDLDTILSGFQRSIRLRLSHERGVEDDLLLVKYVSGSETICDGIDSCVQCVSAYSLPSQQLIGCPIELQFDTTCDGPRFVCGIITRVLEGLSQDGLFTFELTMQDALAVMEQCLAQFRSLGNYAANHQALPLDDLPQTQLHASLAQWEHGSNTLPKIAPKGGAAIIGVSAPDGISFATPKTIVNYAGGNLDGVAQQHVQFTAGQRFNLNAGKGISLFAHNDGIKAIAHHGKFLMQSQHDDTLIQSAKNVNISASEGKIVLAGVEIELIAEDGSFIRIGKGITLGSKGPLKIEVAGVQVTGPATMQAELPGFDSSGEEDKKFVFTYGAQTAGVAIAPHRKFEIDMHDGSTVKGTSDATGQTSVLQRDATQIAHIRILTEPQ